MYFNFLAYIDPGTGSIIIQIIIGAVLSGIFFIKLFFKRISNFLKRIFSGFGKKNEEK